jgi:type I restriction enzyme, S subunit
MGDPPGDACVYPAGRPPAIITADCIKFRVASKRGSPRFFAYAFGTPAVRAQVLARTKGVAQQKISLDTFRSLKLPVPPPAEQDRIVAEIETQFTRLDAGVAALEHVRAHLRRYRAAVLKAAVSGRLVAPEGRGSLPTGWVLARLGGVVENHDGRRIPVKASDRAQRQGDYPYYGASGVIDHVDDFLFDGDFLLVAEDGANLLSRSTPIAFPASGKFWVNNHAHVLRPREGVLLAYLEIALNASDLQFCVTGSAQPKLTQAALNDLSIPLPPLAEQHRIVTEVEKLSSVADAVEQMVKSSDDRARRLRSSILRSAFDGRLVAPEQPARAPAA